MRVIVFGSRKWRNPRAARRAIVNRLFALNPEQTVIVHGDAAGADRMAADEANKLGLLTEAHPYQPFISETVGPKRAPLVRNEHMASLGADLALGFWNGSSTGSMHMRSMAEQAGIPVEMIEVVQ